MESFLAQFGYAAVFLGVLVEGEAVLVAAGALAHRGDLSLPWVMLMAFLGSVIGDQGWFHVGARFGPRFLARHGDVARRAGTVRGWLARYGTAFVVGFRFLYGFRTATPILLGATHYPTPRFAVLNTIGAALWAVTFSVVGYAVGATFAAMMKRAGRIEELIAAGLVVALALAMFSRRTSRSRGRDTSAEGPDRGSASHSRG